MESIPSLISELRGIGFTDADAKAAYRKWLEHLPESLQGLVYDAIEREFNGWRRVYEMGELGGKFEDLAEAVGELFLRDSIEGAFLTALGLPVEADSQDGEVFHRDRWGEVWTLRCSILEYNIRLGYLVIDSRLNFEAGDADPQTKFDAFRWVRGA